MKRIRTIEVASHIGERVSIAGWLHSLRQMGGINFLVIRDGWGTIQAVAETEAEMSSLVEREGGLESVLSVEGLIVDMPQAPGGVELHNLHIEVITPVADTLTEQYANELEVLHIQVPLVPATIPHIHFSDAQELIFNRYATDVRGEPDLSPQDERWLGEWAQQEYSSDFLFVTGYPMRKRPFYTHPDPARPEFSNSFDLLFRGTELVTGGQRLHLYKDYLAALESARLPLEPFETYLEAFRYGMPPHGGFAIGLERLLMQLSGAPNVRLTTLFPRDLTRLTP